ncbi:tetratricopeptide repeat protein [Thermocrinis sp.]
MVKRLLLLSLLLFSCGNVTQEELNFKLSQLNSRIAKLEEEQKKLENQQLKTEERIDTLSRGLAGLRLEVEKLKTAQRSQHQENKPVEKKEEARGPETVVKEVNAKDYERDYQEAISLYNLKQLNQAKEKFIDFIKNHPKTPLTDNAYLWLGVIYRDLGDSKRAEATWRTLEERCKKGDMVDCNKLPSAYIQLARLYESTGDASKAKEYYELLLKDFPLSEEAELAKRKLGGQ